MPQGDFLFLENTERNVPKTGRKPGKSKTRGFPETVLEKTK